MSDQKLYSASVERNRAPILAVLASHIGARRSVLEVASGSGGHVAHFAAALPDVSFQPSDPDAGARASIDAWAATSALHNVRAAIALDAASDDWPDARFDVVVCLNMVHISPWSATVGLMRGAASVLASGGLLFLYGPYRRDGQHTAPSNAEFDASLRARNPAWGVRDLEAVAAEAQRVGFAQPLVQPMPANNLVLVFQR